MTGPTIDPERLQTIVKALPMDNLALARAAAARKFSTAGLPTKRQEEWKYTDLSLAAEISNAWFDRNAPGAAILPTAPATTSEVELRHAIDAHWIVIRNGIVAATELSTIMGQLGSGISVSRVIDEKLPELSDDDPLSAFNVALLRDGLRISLQPGAAPGKPLGLIIIDDPSSEVTQTRVIVEAGANSRLRLVECCLSAAMGRQFTNSVLEARLAQGASLDHVRIQSRASDHVSIGRAAILLDRDARLKFSNFDFGGALSRNDVIAEIVGPGGSVNLSGLYLTTGEQHVDNHTCIVHSVGPSTSGEEYRGILAGRSRGIFNGKIVVAAGADGTDSTQSNHNLLLSDRAEIDTKPELEIYADDVKCAHGATVGQLDESALFYLQSRGLDKSQARHVLTRAFAAGLLGTLAVPECHDYLTSLVDRRLESMVGDHS